MKIHMKAHSYKSAAYQFFDCDFCGDSKRTMNVHLGKHHSETYECGLCECENKNLEDLELHLFTCERYECHQKECNFNSQTISEIKNHIREKHEEGSFIHLKMNR